MNLGAHLYFKRNITRLINPFILRLSIPDIKPFHGNGARNKFITHCIAITY